MDQYIAGFAGARDRDLVLCHANGVAYQADMSRPIDYGAAYFGMYAGYAGTEIERRLNIARASLVNGYASDACEVLDIGVGSGAFIRYRAHTYGFDVNPVARDWLQDAGRWRPRLEDFRAFSMWDVLEHVPRPADYFNRMAPRSLLFLSMPIFDGLDEVRASKHYKPDEHFYYFTEQGLIDWLTLHGFRHLETNDDETRAGREAIKSFAFIRDRLG